MPEWTQEERVDEDFVEGLREVLNREQRCYSLCKRPLREWTFRRVLLAEESQRT